MVWSQVPFPACPSPNLATLSSLNCGDSALGGYSLDIAGLLQIDVCSFACCVAVLVQTESRTCLHPELICQRQDGVNGFCVPSANRGGYEVGLRKLVLDESLRRKVRSIRYP